MSQVNLSKLLFRLYILMSDSSFILVKMKGNLNRYKKERKKLRGRFFVNVRLKGRQGDRGNLKSSSPLLSLYTVASG